MPQTLYTLGYGGRHADDFFALLSNTGVNFLVDVRKSARTRLPGFHGTTLARRCEAEKIEYQHVPLLGNANYDAPDDAPIQLVDPEAGREILEDILSREGVVATIMCACRDFRRCHRLDVAGLMVAALPDLAVVHLE